MPKRRLPASEVENSVLVKKLALFAISDGIACTSRKIAIRPMDTTIASPDAVASREKMTSPRSRAPVLRPGLR